MWMIIVNDNSGSAEGTIYENELVYKELDLPKLNDSVLVLGFGSKKELKKGEGITNYILKIKILRFKSKRASMKSLQLRNSLGY